MHATLLPLCIHLCLLPSLTQTLSSLFLPTTKQQFTVLPIKAYIHLGNYQWHDSFDLEPLHLISHLPFSKKKLKKKIFHFHLLSLEARLSFSVTWKTWVDKITNCLELQVSHRWLISLWYGISGPDQIHVEHCLIRKIITVSEQRSVIFVLSSTIFPLYSISLQNFCFVLQLPTNHGKT